MSQQIDGMHHADQRSVPLPERLPAPTVWPATMALGVTLLSFSVVTSWIIAISGLILFLLSAAGWFGDLRNDQFE